MPKNVAAVLAEINSTKPVLEQIASKWSVLILAVLCEQPSRFNAIKRRLDPITHKALTEALRKLERNGLVNRNVIATSPVAVEYSITALGLTLQQPFAALIGWAQQYGPELMATREAHGDGDRAQHGDARASVGTRRIVGG